MPTTAGPAAATLFITSNATNSPTPIQLAATAVNPPTHFVSLAWQAVAGYAIAYNVYRGTTSGGPYVQQNVLPITATTFTDLGVSGDTTYYYVVTTLAYNGAESVNSNEVSAAVPGP